MVFKTSIYTRIFQGNGNLQEISLILNLFNKCNGIYNILKIIKTHKLISFDLIKIIKKLTSDLLNILKLNNFNFGDFFFKEREYFFKFLVKIFIYFVIKQNLPKNLKILFFSELKKNKIIKKNISFYNFSKKKNVQKFIFNG